MVLLTSCNQSSEQNNRTITSSTEKNEFERASNNEKKKNSQIIELLEDRREQLTGQLNASIRVKALD